MFAKLLKYEWKATAGTLGVFSLAALGVGVMATVLLRIIANFSSEIPPLLWLPIGTMLGGCVMAILAYCIGTEIFLVIRFYKNKFTDEGYLTFTLPVTTHQIVWSSLINFIGWSLITVAVSGLTVGMTILFGPVEEGFVNQDLWNGFGFLLESFGYFFTNEVELTYGILAIVQALTGYVLSVVQIMTAITLGASIAKKHKVLASFGIYYGMNLVISIISSLFSVFSILAEIGSDDIYAGLNITYGIQVVLNLALCAAGYLIMNHIMKRKLNLP